MITYQTPTRPSQSHEAKSPIHVFSEFPIGIYDTAISQAEPQQQDKGLYVTLVQYDEPFSQGEMRLKPAFVTSVVEYDPISGLWMAIHTRTDEYGTGETWESAIEDMIRNLHSTAAWYRENRDRTAPRLRAKLETLLGLFEEP